MLVLRMPVSFNNEWLLFNHEHTILRHILLYFNFLKIAHVT